MAKAKAHAGSWSDDPTRAEKDNGHLATMEAAPPKAVEAISLPRLDIRVVDIKLIGDSSLICHRWSEKSKKIMHDKHTGKASAGRELKVPEQDFLDSLYPMSGGGYGFPTIAFKNAAVQACTSLGKSVTKVAAKQAFHIMGNLTKIEGTPQPREDMVRVGMGTADIRYRGEFDPWSVTIRVRYNARLLSAEQLINLMNTAGFAVGVGEWRSERNGSQGLFHVAKGDE